MARKKGPQAEEAYQYIRDRITKFSLLPGEEISDSKFDSLLDMSRSPIREAILRLQADGLIENSNGKLVVASLSARDIIEICQVRRSIEVSSMELLLDHGGPDAETLAELETILQSMKSSDRMRNYDQDDKFHNLLLQAAGNSRMIEIGNKMRLQISRARWLNLIFPERLTVATREHEEIFEALSKNDRQRACAALARHLDNSAENFKLVLSDPSMNAQFLRGIASMLSDTSDT